MNHGAGGCAPVEEAWLRGRAISGSRAMSARSAANAAVAFAHGAGHTWRRSCAVHRRAAVWWRGSRPGVPDKFGGGEFTPTPAGSSSARCTRSLSATNRPCSTPAAPGPQRDL